MKNNIKIAVLGGTGKSGKYLVEQLISQGFPIKMLIRNPEHFQILNPLVEVVLGDVSNSNAVHLLIEDCSAVISTLGFGIPPSEPSIFSKATKLVIEAMNNSNIQRYIVVTGLHVDTSSDKKSAKTTMATEWMKKNYPISTADRQLEYDILTASKLDWTLVRLPMIELTSERNQLAVSLEDCPGEKISATDLAHFLVDQLLDNRYIRKAPFLARV